MVKKKEERDIRQVHGAYAVSVYFRRNGRTRCSRYRNSVPLYFINRLIKAISVTRR